MSIQKKEEKKKSACYFYPRMKRMSPYIKIPQKKKRKEHKKKEEKLYPIIWVTNPCDYSR